MKFWKNAKGPRMKYGNRHTACDRGVRPHSHDSMVERDRCFVLHTMQERGEIRGLMVHEVFKLEVNGVLVTRYEADFSYIYPERPACLVIEDVKGVRTREYLIKRALMKALYQIDITEVP